MTRNPVLLFILILVFLSPTAVQAAWRSTLPTDDGLAITVRSPFDEIPPVGYLPLEVTISNDSDSPLTYEIVATTTFGYGTDETIASTNEKVTVPPSQRFAIPLLVPVVPKSTNTGADRRCAVTVIGPGIENPLVNFPSTTSSLNNRTSFTALSADLALRSWGPLKEQAEKDGHPLVGTQFEPNDLPTSWLGLSGLATLWITASELDTLAPAQRTALDDWIRQGGHLFLITKKNSTRSAAEFPAPGIGTVTLRTWDGRELPTAATLADLRAEPRPTDRLLSEDYVRGWKLADLAGRLRLPVLLLVAFIVLFAVTVGPLNLFVFARTGRRQRLFWTTPLISIVASLLLGVIIWLQDGSGGDGQRTVLGVLLPDTNQLLIRQEQVSRSGLLLDRDFTLTEDALVAPISLTGDPTLETARRFEQTGKNLSGQWFNSRSVQAQYLQTIVPTRARIELVNTADDGTPTLLSSVPFTLEEILYLDDSGQTWHGTSLRTGETIALAKSTPETTRALHEKSRTSGPLISQPWQKFWTSPKTFLATTTEGPYLETLPTIRWTNHQTFLTGPVNANAVLNSR